MTPLYLIQTSHDLDNIRYQAMVLINNSFPGAWAAAQEERYHQPEAYVSLERQKP